MGTKAMFKVLLPVALFVLFLAANVVSEDFVDAQVPVLVNVPANVKIDPPVGGSGTGDEGEVTANDEKTFNIRLSVSDMGKEGSGDMTYLPPEPANSKAFVSYSNGNITLNLQSQQYQNAVISLHSINGKQLLRSNVSASGEGKFNVSNIPVGVYLLSVKGAKGNFFVTKLAFSGDGVNINATFNGGDNSPLKKKGDYGTWTITVSAPGYETQKRDFEPDEGLNSPEIFMMSRAGSSSSRSSSSVSSSSRSSSSGSSSSRSSSSNRSSSSATDKPTASQNYTETVSGTDFKMIYVNGGTFTMGCEQSSDCPPGTTPTSQVTLHNYFISETEVTANLWKAVMGGSGSGNRPQASFTWYAGQEFLCKLKEKTGRTYRMATEAEWEYAAKGGKNGIGDKYRYAGSNNESDVVVTGSGPANVKSKQPNQLGIYDMNGNVDEWVYNSWLPDPTSSASTNPIGPGGQIHTQKTRRGGYYDTKEPSYTRQISARRIRSIDGADGSIGLRIAYSEQLPPDMRAPCDIHPPKVEGGEPENSYRDLRWVTGDDYEWRGGGNYTSGSIGESTFKLWADGAAVAKVGFSGSTVQGQWYTVNNIALVIVPNSGSRYRWPYIFMSDSPGEELISVISDKGFNGFIGRLKKVPKTSGSPSKPSISNVQTPTQLAAANSPADVMIDMVNIPTSVQEKDSRLLDGANYGWFQDNTSMQATHHYRKDVDANSFRFAVLLSGNTNLLAGPGDWFTVGNTFLRVKNAQNGYTTEYLYTITTDGEFHHVSYQAYERGDFRMFKKTENSKIFPRTTELPTTGTPVYNSNCEITADGCGKSTFVPAPCPSGGCR